MPVPPDVSIRVMTARDIPAGLRLCRAARWNQTSADWEFFLSSAPAGALVAEERGSVVGSVATLPYGAFTWISMVLVDPAARSRGVGRLLLERGLALVPDHIAARLDATPAGEPLYRTLGFAAEFALARWLLPASGASVGRGFSPGESKAYVRPLASGDWPAILQMDRHVFGASRQALIERMAAEAPEYAWVLAADGRVRAYLFGRHGHLHDHLGPLVADTRESAQMLLHGCLDAHPGRTFFFDAPDRDDGWSDVLTDLGFAIERPFRRMRRGRLSASGNPSVVYAVTGPEFG